MKIKTMITEEDVLLYDILGRCYENFALINDLTNKLIYETREKTFGVGSSEKDI